MLKQQIERLYADYSSDSARPFSKASSSGTNTSESVWSSPKIIDIENQLYDLLNQISQTDLPKTKEPVVVVAEFKKEGDRQSIVYKGNVWREKKIPAPPTQTVQSQGEEVPEQHTISKEPSHLNLIRVILGFILILISVIVVALLLLVDNNTPMKTEPETNPTTIPQEIRSKKTIPVVILQPKNSPLVPKNHPITGS